MQATISPGNISGSITTPPSKSYTQRVCAAALLHKGKTYISNTGRSDDEKAAIRILEQSGLSIIENENGVLVIEHNEESSIADTIHCHESGLAARLFIPVSATFDKEVTVTGSGSLLQRPMNMYADILPQLEVNIHADDNHLPVTVRGPLQTKNISIDGSTSSQFISGLLTAYAFRVTEPVTISVDNLKSKAYVDMTIDVLRHFDKIITKKEYKEFTVAPFDDNTDINVFINIEGDWSSAAALLVAGALSGEITVEGLNMQSAQPDRAIVEILKQAGAAIETGYDNVTVSNTNTLKAFSFDATDAPDLFPVLSVLATQCKGNSRITGLHRLANKESNREESIKSMLSAFGVNHSVEGDTLIIEGQQNIQGATIDSYNDHRIVMAATIAGLIAEGNVTITNADAVSKSYPDFFAHLLSVGAQIKTDE